MQEKIYKILCDVVMKMNFNFPSTFNATFKFSNKPLKHTRLRDKRIILEHHAPYIDKTFHSKESFFLLLHSVVFISEKETCIPN